MVKDLLESAAAFRKTAHLCKASLNLLTSPRRRCLVGETGKLTRLSFSCRL